ncbi:MAG: potassium/proton antiporter [Planctomycetota bacterium]
MFAILRGGRLRVADRVRSVIETESCVNDPMAVLLTVALVQSLGPDGEFRPLSLLLIPLQFAIGGVVGAAIGYATRWLLGSCRFTTAGLYPVVVLASAFLAFGVATLFWGSGLLAVFVAAVILGRGPLPYRGGLIRVHDALAWMSQVGMFVMLGLLVYPSQLFPVAGIGLALGVGLACIARPLAVAACLAPFGMRGKEIAYVSWVGIRGAVPIILATIPVMAGFEQGERIFHIVFFIVVVSAIVPGATILPLTRRLGFAEGENPAPAAAVEMHTLAHANADIKLYVVHQSVAAAGATLATIPFPPEAAVVLVVRGQQLLPPRGATRIEAGDHVYVFCRPGDEPLIGLIFGAPSDV